MTKDQRVRPQTLKGFRDLGPRLMAARYHLMDVLRAEAKLAGFEPMGTPALEYAETLLGQGGAETDKQVYRFRDHGDREVALRFDLTVPAARFVAQNMNDLVFPFKRLQIGDVWRGEKPQKGRYREFAQGDLDIIGVDTAAADIEILLTLQRSLARAQVGPLTVALGHRQVLAALISQCLGVPAGEAQVPVLIALDKLDKIGAEKVVGLLIALDGLGIEAESATKLLTLLQPDDSGNTNLDAVRQVLGEASADAGLERLEATLTAVRAAAVPQVTTQLNLSIARGLGYYTGVVFETTLDELPSFGSVSSGGRYNDLASRFTTQSLPGVGGSIGIDRLLAALEELDRLPVPATQPVLVAVADEVADAYAWELVHELRSLGLVAHRGLSPQLKKQIRQADRLGCAAVLTVGEREQQQNTVALKRLADGHSIDLPRSEALTQIQQWVKS